MLQAQYQSQNTTASNLHGRLVEYKYTKKRNNREYEKVSKLERAKKNRSGLVKRHATQKMHLLR